MKKLFTLLLSVFAIGGVSAQSTDTGYRAVPVAEKAWPQTATVATTDNSKDVVFRSNNHPDYFVSSTDTELKVMNDGTRDKFRIFSTATANQYKIYNVTKSKFVKWTVTTNQSSATRLVDENEANTWLIVNDNNGNEAKVVDIIAGGRTAYAKRAPCWNPHGGFGHNKVIGTWNANDPNSSWQICEAMVLTAPEFVTNYNAAEKWYSVTLRGKKVAYDRETNKMNFSDLPGAPSLFQFVGTRDGFKIYNRAAGNTKALGSANVATNEEVLPVEAAMAKTFRLEMGYDRGRCQDAWVIRSTTTNNGYLHDYREKVSYWVNGNAKTDYGSVFVFTPEIFNPLAEFNYEKATALELLNKWNENATIKKIYGADNISEALRGINELTPAEDEAQGTQAVQTIKRTMEQLYTRADGKKIVLTCPTYPTRRMTVDVFGRLMGVEATTNNASNVFTLKSNKAALQLTHAASERKVQAPSAYNTAIIADNNAANFDLKTVAGNNEQVAFQSKEYSSKISHNNACLHMANTVGYAIVPWEAVEIGGSTWTVEVVNMSDADIKVAAKARLLAAEELFTSTLGNGLHQYVKIPNDAYRTAQSSDANVAQIEAGVKSIVNRDIYTLNLPRQGQFLRIKSKGGTKYVSMNPITTEDVNKDRLSTVTSADASTLLYYNGTTLTGVQSGKGIGVMAKPGNDGYKAYVLAHGEAPKQVSFRASPSDKSFYNILVGSDTETQGLWLAENGAYVDGSTNWRDMADANRLQLEEVTEIQVPLGSAGVASFVIPATVKMTVSGATPYKVTQTGSGTATLTSLEGAIGSESSEVAIVLKGTPNANATLTVSATNVQGAADISGNMLIGSVAASATTNKTAEGDYGLKVSGSEAYFAKTNADIPFRPFRAVLRTTTAQGVSAFSLNFGEDNVTAIETVDTTTQDAPVFDLSGRRVTKTVKGGVYIKNGQKIVQQ